jgi:dihydroneopterin aldolase
MWIDTPSRPRLYITDLTLFLGIGCSEGERSSPQELRLSLAIEFPGYPPGINTDQLNDTTCYHRLCDHLTGFVLSRQYQLIEKLAYEAYHEIKNLLPPASLLQITVHKVAPPIENLQGGIRYVCGDPLP